MKGIGYYLGHITMGLVIAQLLNNLDSSMVFAIGLMLLCLHAFYILHIAKDEFLFMLYMFALCYIATFDILGGIALVCLLTISYGYLTGKRLKIQNQTIKVLLSILVVVNFIGYVFVNETGMFSIFQAVIIFTGIILMFVYVQQFHFLKRHGKTILNVITYLSVLGFLASFNQKFVLIESSLPLLGAARYFDTVSSVTFLTWGRSPSLMGDFEIFAELSLLLFILASCIILDDKMMKYFDLKLTPYILLGTSFLNILMTGTRSGFILLVVFMFMLTVVRFKVLFSSAFSRVLIILLAALPMMILFSDVIGLDIILNRLQQLNLDTISLESIRSGEGLNRKLVYEAGFKRLAQQNWLFGFGFGTGEANHWAWYGSAYNNQPDRITDFHSLYLSLPMIYGWIGGICYLAMVLYVCIASFVRFLTDINNPVRGLMLGFSFLFLFFLLDQIKINSLRYYHYHLLIWILMGFALSLLNSTRKGTENQA